MKEYKYYPLLCGLFVASLLTSNILSAAKIVDLGVSIFGTALVIDAGTFIFPLCYILGDLLTEVYGYKQTKKVIWVGFFSSLVLIGSVYFISLLPAESLWQETVGDTSYQKILGSIANGGIFIASLVAYLVGEFSNSAVLSKMKILTQGKMLWLRTMSSTFIGQFLDSLIFVLLACFLKVFPWEIFSNLVLTAFLLKVAFEFLFTPFLYLLARFLKKQEKLDTYDYKVSYNPFSLN